MRTLLRVLLLLACAPACQAETNACTTIASVPFVISTPGPYCLQADMTVPSVAGTSVGIDIVAADVVLDCNGHRLIGERRVSQAVTVNDRGIRVQAARATIRNCLISGFQAGIALPGSNTTHSDTRVEDNWIEGADYGILGILHADGVVRRNKVLNSWTQGINIYVRTSHSIISDNLIARTGNETSRGSNTVAAEFGGWAITENNRFVESVVVPGENSVSLWVGIIGGGGVPKHEVRRNIVLAPATAADNQPVQYPIWGTSECRDNVVVGFGSNPANASCGDPSNQWY